jgi:uncharacterized membrane protein HdeD (DUF308 family)
MSAETLNHPSSIALAVGAFLAIYPGLSLLALVYTIGWYAAIAGVSLIGLALRVRGLHGLAAQPAL